MKMNKNLAEEAAELYFLNLQIKELTEKADKIKKGLRLKMKENIEFTSGDDTIVCKLFVSSTPIIVNKKLYEKLTDNELVKATKPVLSEIKAIFKDEYEEIIEKVSSGWEMKESIRFCIKK
jgi:hypothetical protein